MLFIIEFVGTFIFLSAILAYAGKNTHAAAIIGLALAAMVYWGGGHYNPAATFMYYMVDPSSGSDAIVRIAAQIVGALAAFYWPRLL